VNELSWDIRDMLGNTLLSNTGQLAGFGPSSVRKCIDMNSCYTFSIAPNHSSRYTVKLDGDIIATGDKSFTERTTMFGGLCLEKRKKYVLQGHTKIAKSTLWPFASRGRIALNSPF